MPTRQLSGEKKFSGGLTYSTRSIRQGRPAGERGEQGGWTGGKKAGRGPDR